MTSHVKFPGDFLKKCSELFLQVIGTAIGIRPATSYANIFMAKMDKIAENLAAQFSEGIHPIRIWKRFLDDIFIIWTGSIEKLHSFLKELNTIHPSIKFTMSHTKPEDNQECDCPPQPSIPFLDTSISILDDQISVDLYRKPTDRCQYLLPSSCHPAHVTENIPFSLAYRIVRICSSPTSQRLDELKRDVNLQRL